MTYDLIEFLTLCIRGEQLSVTSLTHGCIIELSDSFLLCLLPAPAARAQFSSLSYWLCCSVAPPTTGRTETTTDRNKKKRTR